MTWCALIVHSETDIEGINWITVDSQTVLLSINIIALDNGGMQTEWRAGFNPFMPNEMSHPYHLEEFI